MVRIGKYSKTEELKQIWKYCYDDSEEYIDFFMEYMLGKIDAAVSIREEKAVGVMYLIPCKVFPADEKAYYWYAGGVLPEYRNKGVFLEIVDEILDFTHKMGRKSFCYAMPELQKFYQSKGLKWCYSKLEVEFRMHSRINDMKIKRRELNPGEYQALRNGFFSDIPHILWEKQFLYYAVLEKRFCGGIGDLLEIGKKKYGVLGEIWDNTLYIEESTFTYKEMNGISDYLCSLYGVKKIYAPFPIPLEKRGEMSVGKCERIYAGLGDIDFTDLWVSLTLL